jgi:hypothetical protein
MKARRRTLALVLGLGLAWVQGCGYALVGKGVAVDPTIKRIGVPLFRDRTGKAGLDQRVTKAVIEELQKRGKFEVVQTAEGVDALVDVELTGYNVAPVAFEGAAGATQASRYAIVLSARVRYSKTDVKEPIWSSDHFSYRDDFDLGDAVTFFDREDQAIDRLTQAFARQLVSAMLEAF